MIRENASVVYPQQKAKNSTVFTTRNFSFEAAALGFYISMRLDLGTWDFLMIYLFLYFFISENWTSSFPLSFLGLFFRAKFWAKNVAHGRF